MIRPLLQESKCQQGFTLVELLVVVLIIGVLAAISIPTFMGQREEAFRAAIQSDLRNVAVEAESYYTYNDSYDGFEGDALFMNFRRSGGVALSVNSADTTAVSFCVEATHSGLSLTETWSYQNDRTPQLGDAAC